MLDDLWKLRKLSLKVLMGIHRMDQDCHRQSNTFLLIVEIVSKKDRENHIFTKSFRQFK